MDPSEIEKLHRICIERLKGLISQANHTCSLLDTMTEFPISFEVWQKAAEQRLRENDAYAQYQEIRERLFQAIRPRKLP